jgi:hypothetical protein
MMLYLAISYICVISARSICSSLFELEPLYHALCRLDWFFSIDHIDHIPHTNKPKKMRTKEIKQI